VVLYMQSIVDVLRCADLHDAGHLARLACGTHCGAVTALVAGRQQPWLQAGVSEWNERVSIACGFAGVRDFLGCRDDRGIIVMAAHQQIVRQLETTL
jgi:hypothetical protein